MPVKWFGHWTIGGAEAVILALLRVLGNDGTLMMPTHTSENTEPSYWQHPPVPENWWNTIREHKPAYGDQCHMYDGCDS